jgi:hypothetical protein
MKSAIEVLVGPRLLKASAGPAAGKGRGVFATAALEPGEIIDVCPCVELDAQTCSRILDTRIDDYYFKHPADDERGLLVLGLASLFNHSDDANANTCYEHDPVLGWLVVLTAARRILPEMSDSRLQPTGRSSSAFHRSPGRLEHSETAWLTAVQGRCGSPGRAGPRAHGHSRADQAPDDSRTVHD